MKATAVTDIGKTRAVNQDYVYASLEEVGCLPNLFIVADGMGGHKAGDTASRFTVETFKELVSEAGMKDPISVIDKAVQDVNTMLIEKASESLDYTGMGTTLVIASIFGDKLRVANVGDSRLYIISDEIRQITRDHSLVEEMVMLGKLTRNEARLHEKKNVITRAIGGEASVEAEMFTVAVKPGDKILMCSDGLTNMVEDTEIGRIVQSAPDIDTAARMLVDTANENGGNDNISIVIIEV